MADLNNSFIAGVMNKDLDERLLPEGVYRDALNVIVDSSANSAVGTIQNQNGNIRISNVKAVAGFTNITNAKTIGAVCSEKDNLIYWLVSCDQFDGIYEYNEITGNTVRVLQSNKPTPTTPSKLNFSQEFIVTGINYVNGFLFWTDNYNPPRRINIARVKSDSLGTGGYSIDDPRIDDDINVILAPPLNAPSIRLYKNTATQSNNIKEKFIYFSYQYKYVDSQYSSLSPFSAVAFQPKEFVVDYAAGNNKSMVNEFNEAEITVFTGSQFVKEIRVIMKDSRAINSYIIETFDKEELQIQDEVFYTFKFSNNKVYASMPNDQITRLFDNVPLLAKAQDFVGNRIMYGNYTQFFDIVDPVNFTLDYISLANNTDDPIQTFRSDRDYEVGLIYLDDYGRSTTTLTCNTNTVYIPPTQSAAGNSIKITIKNKAPEWATGFRVVLKQNKEKYYNIFPIISYEKPSYRYFLINESDRDKIEKGDYIIFKGVANGPTFSNQKYKILQIKQYDYGEIVPNSTAGLYFKIKVDDQSIFSSGVIGLFGNGYGSSIGGNIRPVINTFPCVELPIYYGNANGNVLYHNGLIPSIASTAVTFGDQRITIQVLSNNQFRYSYDFQELVWATNSNGVIDIQNIVVGTPNVLTLGIFDVVEINWSALPVVGDKWKLNIRGEGPLFTQNYFGGTGLLTTSGANAAYWTTTPRVGGYVPLKISDSANEPILNGDIITIQITNDTYNVLNYQIGPQQFIVTQDYYNIEEWFVESGAWQTFQAKDTSGNNQGYKAVSFRRGIYEGQSSYSNGTYQTIYDQGFDYNSNAPSPGVLDYPLLMIIEGYGYLDSDPNGNQVSATISIQRSSNTIIAEVTEETSDIEVYHEMSDTYLVEDGYHKPLWEYKDYTALLVPSPYAGKTNLGQLIPGSNPSATDKKHNYIAGEKVWVKAANITPGFYDILYVPDPYNIVIDLAFPGAGPTIPGTTGYQEIETNQTGFNTPGTAAILTINNPYATINSNFNAWSYRNGLETFRIRDDFNQAHLIYSPRVSTTVDGYGKKVSKNAICYSGILGENTGINRLNEFNLSIANFKYLDGEFGSIQKLYARDTDLLVLQENKVSTVLYGKNLLSDSVGGGQVTSVPEILGTQIAYPYEYGISKNPESFSFWGDTIFFTDSRRGVVLQMAGNQIVEISSNGMKDYFMELMRDYPNTQKIGGYDPHNHHYMIASNDISILGCILEISRNDRSVPANGQNYAMFNITSDVDWEITVQSLGSGTNWVSNYQTFGSGSQNIGALVSENTTGHARSIKFIVTYCTNKTQEFILTQGSTYYGGVVLYVNS